MLSSYARPSPIQSPFFYTDHIAHPFLDTDHIAHPPHPNLFSFHRAQGFRELAAISERANTKIVIPRGRNVNHLDMLLMSYYTVRYCII